MFGLPLKGAGKLKLERQLGMFMGSRHGFLTAHWDHEPPGKTLTRPSDTLSHRMGEGRGEGRFMESRHGFLSAHLDHEPPGKTLTRPSDTLSHRMGEGRGEGRFMESAGDPPAPLGDPPSGTGPAAFGKRKIRFCLGRSSFRRAGRPTAQASCLSYPR